MGAIVVLTLAAAGYWYFSAREGAVEETQLPNPASVHCTETLGGTLQIVDTSEGQIGVCRLPDGRRCEEWELYRTGACVLPSEVE